MKVTEQFWSKTGKLLTGVGTIIGLTLGGMQLWHSVHGPSVVAVVDRQSNVLPPNVRDRLKTSFTREDLTRIIEASEKRHDPETKTLSELKGAIGKPKSDLDVAFLDLDSFLSSTAWHVTVTNHSGEVAKDVKLILPGSGKADVSESPFGFFNARKQPAEWKKELAIGTIPAHGRVDLLVWPDEGLLFSLTEQNMAVLHGDGSGIVRHMQHFYGRDADLIAWFVVQPKYVRYGLLLLCGVAGAAVVAWRRGRVRRRETVRTPTPTDQAMSK